MTKDHKPKLSLKTGIMEALELYPDSAEVFQELNLPCLGCVAAGGETLQHIVDEFGVDGNELIEKIKNTKENK